MNLDEIQQIFFQECEEGLATMEASFASVRQGGHDTETINTIFRSVHSIKGGAGAFGLDGLVSFAHRFETALDEGEIITAVKFPIPEKAAYVKFEQPASRFALVGVFVTKGANGVRVAVTGASEGGVFRWTEAEEALSSNFAPSALEGLSLPADGMIGDLHGTPEYRAHLVGVITKRAVMKAG